MTETIAQILADAADGQASGTYTLGKLRNLVLGVVPPETPLAFASTITWNLDSDPAARLTVTGPITITATNGLSGRKYWLTILQDSSGSHDITLSGVTVIGVSNWNTTANGVTQVNITISNNIRYTTINS